MIWSLMKLCSISSIVQTWWYLMMVCRPLTCGVLSNTLRVWGSGCICWAEARRALRRRTGRSDQRLLQSVLFKWSNVTPMWGRTQETHNEATNNQDVVRKMYINYEIMTCCLKVGESKYASVYLTLSSRCMSRRENDKAYDKEKTEGCKGHGL